MSIHIGQYLQWEITPPNQTFFYHGKSKEYCVLKMVIKRDWLEVEMVSSNSYDSMSNIRTVASVMTTNQPGKYRAFQILFNK